MRQVGVLGAAGLYALDHHVKRLAEDHQNAATLAQGIDEIAGLACRHQAPSSAAWTNLVYFTVDGAATGDPSIDALILTERLRARGVLAIPLGTDGKQIRMVTHLDVSASDIDVALDALRSAMDET